MTKGIEGAFGHSNREGDAKNAEKEAEDRTTFKNEARPFVFGPVQVSVDHGRPRIGSGPEAKSENRCFPRRKHRPQHRVQKAGKETCRVFPLCRRVLEAL